MKDDLSENTQNLVGFLKDRQGVRKLKVYRSGELNTIDDRELSPLIRRAKIRHNNTTKK